MLQGSTGPTLGLETGAGPLALSPIGDATDEGAVELADRLSKSARDADLRNRAEAAAVTALPLAPDAADRRPRPLGISQKKKKSMGRQGRFRHSKKHGVVGHVICFTMFSTTRSPRSDRWTPSDSENPRCHSKPQLWQQLQSQWNGDGGGVGLRAVGDPPLSKGRWQNKGSDRDRQ